MSNEYEIKVEGAVHTFEGGATRYSKDKGRFDLMPSDIIIKLLEQYSSNDNNVSFSINDAIIAAYKGNYIDAVIIIANQHYKDEKCPVLAMLAELAIHFQKGAAKYGERNCEHGIPLWSFRDSGIRHLTQYILGRTDEPHHISAIWNFVMAEWTIANHPERCMDEATYCNSHAINISKDCGLAALYQHSYTSTEHLIADDNNAESNT